MLFVGYNGLNTDGSFFFGNAVLDDVVESGADLARITEDVVTRVRPIKPRLESITIISMYKLG